MSSNKDKDEVNIDEKVVKLSKTSKKGGDNMAVSLRTTPKFTGEKAKKKKEQMKKPSDNREVLERCRKLAKAFKEQDD